MKLFLVRLLLIALLWLLLTYVIHWPEALITAFVVEYILEPLLVKWL